MKEQNHQGQHNMKTSSLIPGSKEWLEYRRMKIGASDAPIILNRSPWSSPFQLWEQKVLGKETTTNFAMSRGIAMEETARQSFEKKMGVEVFPRCIEHSTLSFMMASLDGIDMDQKTCVEIKCAGKEDHSTALAGRVPDKYYPQLQHQLEVTGLEGMYYFSFDGRDGTIVEVARDQAYIDNMIEQERCFYKCMLDLEPPALTDRDLISMEEDEQWRYTASQWNSINLQLKALEKEEELLRGKLIDLAQDRNVFGGNVRLTKSIAKGAVDYSKISEMNGVDLNQFRKKSYVKWRLTSS